MKTSKLMTKKARILNMMMTMKKKKRNPLSMMIIMRKRKTTRMRKPKVNDGNGTDGKYLYVCVCGGGGGGEEMGGKVRDGEANRRQYLYAVRGQMKDTPRQLLDLPFTVSTPSVPHRTECTFIIERNQQNTFSTDCTSAISLASYIARYSARNTSLRIGSVLPCLRTSSI